MSSKLLWVALALFLVAGAAPADPPPPASPPEPAVAPEAESDQALAARVETAIEARGAGAEAYRDGDYARSLAELEAARKANPADAGAALFLGLVHIRLDDPAKAAVAWSDFVRLAPEDDLAADVRRHVTLLLREAHSRSARAALELESSIGEPGAGDPATVAIAPLVNLGSRENDPLATALGAMLVANLSSVAELRVVERERVQALLDEAKLADNDLVQASTAVRVGKLLQAGRLVSGTTRDWTASPTHLAIDATLFDVGDGKPVGTFSQEGLLEEFYSLVPRIGQELAQGLTVPAAAGLLATHTKNLEAAVHFGRGLSKKDAGDFAGAREEFEKALELDPDFELARRELALLPAALLSLLGIAKSVEGGAFSFVGVGTGVLGGIGTGALIGGGVAAAGLGVGIGVSGVADGGGGGGGDGDGSGGPGTGGPQTGAPSLTGASSRSVRVGQSVGYDLTATDPDGTVVTISADLSQTPNASFTQQPGNPAQATFRWSPGANAVGTRRVIFTATDSGTPPQSVTIEALIAIGDEVTPGPTGGPDGSPTAVPEVTSTPTPPPTATRTPTRTPTLQAGGEECDPQASCCIGGALCAEGEGGGTCCLPFGASCVGQPEGCCFQQGLFCNENTFRCDDECAEDGAGCTTSDDCCNSPCLPVGQFPNVEFLCGGGVG